MVVCLPPLVAILTPTLRDRALALTAAASGLLVGAFCVFRSLTLVSAEVVDEAGLLAWWGGTCILAGLLGIAARLATWQGTRPALRLRIAAGLTVAAFAFFAGQIFEPLGGILARQ